MTTYHYRFAGLAAALLALGTLGAVAQEQAQLKEPPKEQTMPVHEHRMQHDVTILHLVETAQTAADHEAVAKRLDAEAAEFDKQAQHHEQLAKQYRKGLGAGPKGNTDSLARHCDNLVKNFKASATETREMAQLHRDIGKSLAK
ncbi:MAG TPA: hypothetical protein VJS12_14375 [Steroidobacteraceae bacterium]|nr:hypothetical protein [Steroidobacteraceae bacterium]